MSNLAQLWPFEAEKLSQIHTLSARDLALKCTEHITWVMSLPPVLSEAYRIDVTIKDATFDGPTVKDVTVKDATITTRVDVVNLIKMLHGEAVRRDEEAAQKAQLDGDVQYEKVENLKLLARHAQKYVNKHVFSPPEEGRHSDDPPARPPAKSVCKYKEKCNWYQQQILKIEKSAFKGVTQLCPISGDAASHQPCQVLEGTPCGFIFPSKNILKGISSVTVDGLDMHLIRRESCTRDLLFMPEVTRVRAHHSHPPSRSLHNNLQLVQHTGAWSGLLTMLQRIRRYLSGRCGITASSPLHDLFVSVSFNFGKWESGVSRNRGATNCHAHAHILLTRNAALALGKKNKDFEGYLDLPEKDSHMLDIQRLSSYTSSLILSNLQMEVHEIKTEVHEIKTKMDQMEAKMDTKMDRLETRMKDGFDTLTKLIMRLNPQPQ